MSSEEKSKQDDKPMFDFSSNAEKVVIAHQKAQQTPEALMPAPQEEKDPYGGIKNHPWGNMQPRRQTTKDFLLGLLKSRFFLLLVLCMVSVLRGALDIAFWRSIFSVIYLAVDAVTLAISSWLLMLLYSAPNSNFGNIERTKLGPYSGR